MLQKPKFKVVRRRLAIEQTDDECAAFESHQITSKALVGKAAFNYMRHRDGQLDDADCVFKL